MLFDYLDDRWSRSLWRARRARSAALRDAMMLKSTYVFGLRRNELRRLDVADLRPNPHVAAWGPYGSVHVRFGKALRGGLPRRRTVVNGAEFDRPSSARANGSTTPARSSGAADHPSSG